MTATSVFSLDPFLFSIAVPISIAENDGVFITVDFCHIYCYLNEIKKETVCHMYLLFSLLNIREEAICFIKYTFVVFTGQIIEPGIPTNLVCDIEIKVCY